MPNIKIMMGRNAGEVKGLIKYGLTQKGPIALRYPKLKTVDADIIEVSNEDWQIERVGNKGYIISYGPDVDRILKIVEANNLDVTVVNARFIRPIDKNLLDKIACEGKPVLVYEQVVASSSLSMMITYYFVSKKYNTTILNSMAFDNDEIITHGDIQDVLDYYNMGDEDILQKVLQIWKD